MTQLAWIDLCDRLAAAVVIADDDQADPDAVIAAVDAALDPQRWPSDDIDHASLEQAREAERLRHELHQRLEQWLARLRRVRDARIPPERETTATPMFVDRRA